MLFTAQFQLPAKDKEEQEFAAVLNRAAGLLLSRSQNADTCHTVSSVADAGIARLKPCNVRRLPFRPCRYVTSKALAAPFTRWIHLAIRQSQVMVCPRLMHRRAADLDDFESRRSLEYPVADFRRLQDAATLRTVSC